MQTLLGTGRSVWRFRRVPTILETGPYRLFFYSSDGKEPPHIHVRRDRHTCKVWLVRVELARGGSFGPKELGSITRIVAEHQETLLRGWYEFFARRSPADRIRECGASHR